MEHIITPKAEYVKLLDRFTSKKPTLGTLYLTATHLIFVESSPEIRKETWILHHHISTIEKHPLTSAGCPLLIHCKNFRVAHFVISRERDCHDVYSSLLRLSQPVEYEELYAFSYNPKQKEMDRGIGWKMINIREEFQRMGVPNAHWEQTDINENYETCNTYSSSLYTPREATNPTIVGSSKFRSKGRFPVLSYFFKDNNAAICRCSQPLSGFSTRCVEDEQMLQAINSSNPNSSFVYVVDTRPKLNAMANRAAGKGYENEDNYSNIRFQFVGIENIHVMRNSLQKLLEVCELKTPSMSDFLTGLENSGWLRHIKAVMDAGFFISKAVAEENASVLVHCSDGWDRTVQVCSLAGLLLDSYYRTIKGFVFYTGEGNHLDELAKLDSSFLISTFSGADIVAGICCSDSLVMVLIEKEWISMGHKFSQRCGHLDSDPKEVSPVFTQFIECVWHLMEQFPCSFEFNEMYLLEIHDHIYSCQFGNFIGNSQKERQELKIQERTHSLWPFLLEKQYQYRNPLYKPSAINTVLKPNTAPFNFRFWCGMYNRFDRGMQPKQSVLESLQAAIKQKAELEETVEDMNQKPLHPDESHFTLNLPTKLSNEEYSPQTEVLGATQDSTEEHTSPLANGMEELVETISDGTEERENVLDTSLMHQSASNHSDSLALNKLNAQGDEEHLEICPNKTEK